MTTPAPFHHTLLATTGASPQVVTETLYALHHENRPWPDEIVLITTSFGKNKAVSGLLTQGQLRRLCAELGRPEPAFNDSHVWVTPGADGREVEDARSLADHEALANFIMTQVRNLTARPQASVHASLAGGRKTMTFYLGYAMSLFGRAQDTLSHVLVSEGFENLPDFWFPTHQPSPLRTARGQSLCASQARVTLAAIPFIRHRHNLPPVLIDSHSEVQFADLVHLINLGENPQTLRLVVNLPQQSLQLELPQQNDRLLCQIRLGLLELAFYTLMARATLADQTDYARPSRDEADLQYSALIVDELLPLCGLPQRPHIGNTQSRIARDIERLKDCDAGLLERSLNALARGMDQAWFDSRQQTLRKAMERELPPSLLAWVLPRCIWTKDGQRIEVHHYALTPKSGGYGLPLQPSQVHIVEVLSC